jgi:hypothetical protein
MIDSRVLGWCGLLVCGAAAAGCGADRVGAPTPRDATTLVAISGDGQTSLYGSVLDQPIVVRVTDQSGEGVAGVMVTWRLASGAGSICAPSYTSRRDCVQGMVQRRTDHDGRSSVWVFAGRLGVDTVTATVGGLGGSPATFQAHTAGVLIEASPVFDCQTDGDPVRFTGPDGSDQITVAAGDTVAFEFAPWLEPVCEARIVSSAEPEGMGFDSGILHPGDRFPFIPKVPGIWEFRETASGGAGQFTAIGPTALLLRRADGQDLPAPIDHQATVEGMVDFYVLSDTLTLGADGTYRQRALLEARIGTTVIARPIWSDHGRYTITGTAFQAESEYLQFVTFDGVVEAGGAIRLRQDLTGGGSAVDYEFEPAR